MGSLGLSAIRRGQERHLASFPFLILSSQLHVAFSPIQLSIFHPRTTRQASSRHMCDPAYNLLVLLGIKRDHLFPGSRDWGIQQEPPEGRLSLVGNRYCLLHLLLFCLSTLPGHQCLMVGPNGRGTSILAFFVSPRLTS